MWNLSVVRASRRAFTFHLRNSFTFRSVSTGPKGVSRRPSTSSSHAQRVTDGDFTAAPAVTGLATAPRVRIIDQSQSHSRVDNKGTLREALDYDITGEKGAICKPQTTKRLASLLIMPTKRS